MQWLSNQYSFSEIYKYLSLCDVSVMESFSTFLNALQCPIDEIRAIQWIPNTNNLYLKLNKLFSDKLFFFKEECTEWLLDIIFYFKINQIKKQSSTIESNNIDSEKKTFNNTSLWRWFVVIQRSDWCLSRVVDNEIFLRSERSVASFPKHAKICYLPKNADSVKVYQFSSHLFFFGNFSWILF